MLYLAILWGALCRQSLGLLPGGVDEANIENFLEFIEFRSIDGGDNNLDFPDYGKAHTAVKRCVPPAYADGISTPAGHGRMGARELSNVFSMQAPEDGFEFVSQSGLTQWAWQWGQFIDHDVTLVAENPNDMDESADIDIYVPCCDNEFDAECQCAADALIQMFRTHAWPNTGADSDPLVPRAQINEISSFVDGSAVYGSDLTRANGLRTFVDGLLEVTEMPQGDMLPLATEATHVEPNGISELFAAGDVRVNEQTGLIVIHTLFHRLHNVLAKDLITMVRLQKAGAPESEIDEFTYQYARMINTAIIQKITYEDWLPTLFGEEAIAEFLGPYDGYDSSVDPSLCAIFSSAAFRFGHTLLTRSLPLRGPLCQHVFESDLPLASAFFRPHFVKDAFRLFPTLINGFACTRAGEVDTRITEAVRDQLFRSAKGDDGRPLFGILDLMALNLQRGREHGLPDYNTVREALGLEKYSSFEQISDDVALNAKLSTVHDGDINDIDLFLGGLAEKHMTGGNFGELMSAIVLGQFKRLRDGDRFWYEAQVKDGALKDWVKGITFWDVIHATNPSVFPFASFVGLSPSGNIFQNAASQPIFFGSAGGGDLLKPFWDAPPSKDDHHGLGVDVDNKPWPAAPGGGAGGDNDSFWNQQWTVQVDEKTISLLVVFLGVIAFMAYKLCTMSAYRKEGYYPAAKYSEDESEVLEELK